MKKILIFILFTLIPFSVFSQNLRDNLHIKTEIFEVIYSEVLQQPKYVKYIVKCPNGDASRKGMDFYIVPGIITSDHLDYVNNIYDKGHMAPAADFNCTREMLHKTFSYLNCSLQNQDLNRTTWRLLEVRERLLANEYSVVTVEINCIFSNKSIKLNTGATVPDAYIKTIRYGDKIDRYYFKNDKPNTLDYSKYLIK